MTIGRGFTSRLSDRVPRFAAERGVIVSHQTVRAWAEIFEWKFAKTAAAPGSEKLRSYRTAKREIMPGIEHSSHKGLSNRAENSHQPNQRRECIVKCFKSPRQLQRLVSIHNPIANLVHLPRYRMISAEFRKLRIAAMDAGRDIAQLVAA